MPKKYEIIEHDAAASSTTTGAPEPEKPKVQISIDKEEFEAMKAELERVKDKTISIEAAEKRAAALEAELKELKEAKIKSDKMRVLEQIQKFGVDTRTWTLKDLPTLEATLEALKQTHQYTSITAASIPDKPKKKLYKDLRTGEWVE